MKYYEAEKSIDIVRCYECKFLMPLPDDIPEGVKADEIDRVCTYWMSDGLNWNDFCSKGIRGGYEGDQIWDNSIEN